MSTNTVIIDDRDPLVSYTGAWSQGGASLEFDQTTSFSVSAGSTAMITFVGTSVTVYGTVAAKNLSPQASWSFAVDNSIAGTYTPPNNMTSDIHHEALWTSPSPALSNSSHTLVINQTSAASAGVIYLDYIMYSTSNSVGRDFVDDRDSRITYTPAWRQFGSDGDFQHTSQASTNVGDRLSFKFDGKSISFYGGVTSTTVNASMAIDGGPPTFWGPPATASQTNNLIYNSGDLTAGTHELVVTAENDQPVWADYFLVTPNPPGFSPPSSSSSSASSSASSTASSTDSASNTPAPHKKTPIGAIVGPIVGVLVLVALVAAIFVCLRRRRREKSEYPDPPMTQSYAPGPTPFSNYGISNAAGPPHGLSEEQGYSAFLAPSDHNSNLADRDANSPFTSPSDGSHSHSAFVPNASASMSSNPTNFAFTGPGHQPAASLSTTNLASAGHGHRPAASVSTMLTSAPGSSIASGENVSPPQPSVHTGILPSNKLLREAQRYASAPTNRSAASGSSALGDDDLLPPHYSE